MTTSTEAIYSAVINNKVTYSQYGNTFTGWIARILPEDDRYYPGGSQFIDEYGTVTYLPKDQKFLTSEYDDLPPLIYKLARSNFEARTSLRRASDAELKLHRINSEWEAKVQKACELADEKGYCSEFEEIAEAAGFDIPAMEEFDVEVEVTILVTISKEARTLEKARELVDRDDISNAISGEDSIEEWELR